MGDDELLTCRQVSEMTRISTSTLSLWAADRDAGGPAHGPVHLNLGPSTRRWFRSDVLAWLQASRVE